MGEIFSVTQPETNWGGLSSEPGELLMLAIRTDTGTEPGLAPNQPGSMTTITSKQEIGQAPNLFHFFFAWQQSEKNNFVIFSIFIGKIGKYKLEEARIEIKLTERRIIFCLTFSPRKNSSGICSRRNLLRLLLWAASFVTSDQVRPRDTQVMRDTIEGNKYSAGRFCTLCDAELCIIRWASVCVLTSCRGRGTSDIRMRNVPGIKPVYMPRSLHAEVHN